MLDPNERLKRVYQSLKEDINSHELMFEDVRESIEEEKININPDTRDIMNYYYHKGATDALASVKYVMLLWGGENESWFEKD